MKKYILLLFLMLFVGINANSQTILRFRTTAYAQKVQPYNWSEWQNSNMIVTFNLRNDIITIQSPKPQIYKIYDSYEEIYDNGGKSIRYPVVDQDGDYGHLRLRIENNGNSQLYVDFSNISWVYNLVRIN